MGIFLLGVMTGVIAYPIIQVAIKKLINKM